MDLVSLEKIMESHGNYNQSISVNIDIDCSKNKLWKFISSPGYLNLCHPFCKHNKVIQWDNNKHCDELVYLNGIKYIRNFYKWDDKKGYSLLIGGKKNKKKSKVIWEISDNNNETNLKITVFPYFMRKYPKLISDIPYILYIKPRLTNYLESVTKGIKWYMEEKKSVPRNYFGRHPWFS